MNKEVQEILIALSLKRTNLSGMYDAAEKLQKQIEQTKDEIGELHERLAELRENEGDA